MNYPIDSSVGGIIQEKKKTKKLRTELVKIGEEVLRDIEQHRVPNDDVIKRFRDFVDETRSAGIYDS